MCTLKNYVASDFYILSRTPVCYLLERALELIHTNGIVKTQKEYSAKVESTRFQVNFFPFKSGRSILAYIPVSHRNEKQSFSFIFAGLLLLEFE